MSTTGVVARRNRPIEFKAETRSLRTVLGALLPFVATLTQPCDDGSQGLCFRSAGKLWPRYDIEGISDRTSCPPQAGP
jgi:hypothetical protein